MVAGRPPWWRSAQWWSVVGLVGAQGLVAAVGAGEGDHPEHEGQRHHERADGGQHPPLAMVEVAANGRASRPRYEDAPPRRVTTPGHTAQTGADRDELFAGASPWAGLCARSRLDRAGVGRDGEAQHQTSGRGVCRCTPISSPWSALRLIGELARAGVDVPGGPAHCIQHASSAGSAGPVNGLDRPTGSASRGWAPVEADTLSVPSAGASSRPGPGRVRAGTLPAGRVLPRSAGAGGDRLQLSRRGFVVGAVATPLVAAIPRASWAIGAPVPVLRRPPGHRGRRRHRPPHPGPEGRPPRARPPRGPGGRRRALHRRPALGLRHRPAPHLRRRALQRPPRRPRATTSPAFVPLSPIQERYWRAEITSLQHQYRAGVAALDAAAEGQLRLRRPRHPGPRPHRPTPRASET